MLARKRRLLFIKKGNTHGMKKIIKIMILVLLIPFLVRAEPKTVTVLSIDGGGIRGIIPALVIKEIEKRIHLKDKEPKPLPFYFDIVSGTSAGGIITLLLTATHDGEEPLYNTKDIIRFFKTLGDDVFARSLWKRITALSGWTGDKYNPEALEKQLFKYFDDLTLTNTLTNVLIPAYDIAQQKTMFFRSACANRNADKNYYLRDVCRSTSAAPTFFPPAIIYSVDHGNTHILIDGGIAANNPALCAAVHALDLYGKDINLIVVSIGTGTISTAQKSALSGKKVNLFNMGMIDWAPMLIQTMMDSSTDIVDYHLQHVVRKNYYRLQIEIEPDSASLDNVSEENIEALEQYAKKLIKKNSDTIDKIVNLLIQQKSIG